MDDEKRQEADTTGYKNADTCQCVDNRRLIAQKGPDHLLNQGGSLPMLIFAPLRPAGCEYQDRKDTGECGI